MPPRLIPHGLMEDDGVPTDRSDGTLTRGISPLPGPLQDAARSKLLVPQSETDRLLAAAYRALPMLPENIRERVASMLTPEAMGVLAAVGIVWAGSHFFGVGEVFDVLLAGATVLTVGWDAIKALKGFAQFYQKAVHAKSDKELTEAATYFADAILTLGGAIGWTRVAKLLGSGSKGAKVISEAGAARRLAETARRWRLFIEGIQFKVPRDQGMLWSKLGDANAARAMAKKMHLTCLEDQLQKNGFFTLYDREFGRSQTELTRKIWRWVSERYVQSLEGKVTAYVHRARHYQAITEKASAAAKAAGEDASATRKYLKIINEDDPVIVHEIGTLSETLLKNRKITEVLVIDVETGEAFGYRSRELLESLQRLERSAAKSH